MKTILITGIAGFIGSKVGWALKRKGYNVIGVDNINNYYDRSLKKARIKEFHRKTKIYETDISNNRALKKIFLKHKINKVCHIAAQAGVRYSLDHPFVYEKTNNLGTLNLLENCRQFRVKSFIYASSSSVYGGNKKVPFSVADNVDHPISLYAATKKYNELLAHSYHHLFGIRCTGLRFFTVYGPWGRPDMALFKFTKAILAGKAIDLYNNGQMKRDFTYIDDVVQGVVAAIQKDYANEIFNLGNSKTVDLRYFVTALEKELQLKAKKNLLPMQPGDVPQTFADIRKSRRMLNYHPKISVEKGIREFVKWYRAYYKIK